MSDTADQLLPIAAWIHFQAACTPPLRFFRRPRKRTRPFFYYVVVAIEADGEHQVVAGPFSNWRHAETALAEVPVCIAVEAERRVKSARTRRRSAKKR